MPRAATNRSLSDSNQGHRPVGRPAHRRFSARVQQDEKGPPAISNARIEVADSKLAIGEIPCSPRREHAGGERLFIKDGQSAIATIHVDQSHENMDENTPRFELVDDFEKKGKVWKLRLDCRVGATEKVFHTRKTDWPPVLDLIDRGIRRIRISRVGERQAAEYTFTEA